MNTHFEIINNESRFSGIEGEGFIFTDGSVVIKYCPFSKNLFDFYPSLDTLIECLNKTGRSIKRGKEDGVRKITSIEETTKTI